MEEKKAVDEVKSRRELAISVRELVEYTLRSGDLVIDFALSNWDWAAAGTRAHKKIQETRPDVYKAEVPVTFVVETAALRITINGRMDGVYDYLEGVLIDEIKSTHRSVDFFADNENPIHWGQLKVYAYIYACQKQLSTINGQLTYIHTETGKIREYKKTFTITELEVFFKDLFTRYLQWMESLNTYQQVRNESIKALGFPFGTYRPGQRKMALSVYRTIEQGQQLIVEAPTGIGKTMAAIFPALKALGNDLTEKIFYLTAKTTGRQVAQKAMEDLATHGLHLKSLTITAKEKICLSPGCICNGDECPFARGFFDRINEAVETIFKKNALTRDEVIAGAQQFSVCPFELSLELALWADFIICDYNYVFNPRIVLKRFFNDQNEDKQYSFLVDEANNMVDRSREMFSAELYKKEIIELRKKIKKESPEVYKTLGTINSRLVKFKKECTEGKKPLALEEYPNDLSPLLRSFMDDAEIWLLKNIRTSYRKELMDLYFKISWFLKVADQFSQTYAFCAENIETDFRIKLFCIDPSEQLGEMLAHCYAIVFFSATLSPVDYFRQVLGCAADAGVLMLPSPFPPAHLCLVVADQISTLYRSRERTKMTVTGIINHLVKQQQGNYLIYFPSYQYMKMIYEPFTMMNPFLELIVQTPGMSEDEREDFLEKFSADNRGQGKTLVGFAVMGGVFGEGIDLVGDRLTAAVIVGVGLPGISLERELIKAYFDNRLERGFEYAYMYPGMNRVCQAAGRVIRSDKDKGVVLLIDQRFSTLPYRKLFPRFWHPYRLQDEEHLTEMIQQFWTTEDN